MSVGLHTAAIHTDLSSTEDDRTIAEQICLVASWFKQSAEGRHVTSLDVEVYGEQGDLLAVHDDVPDRTSARISEWNRRATSVKLLPADYQSPPTSTGDQRDDGRHGS